MRYILIILFLFNVASAQSLFGVVASDGFDADARRYLDSAGITNQTHRQALNNFVKGLKGNGLWSKMVAIYPMMGSTSSSMQWNLKDPRNLDAAYRLSFLGGGWTFGDSFGALPNGTSSYANTFCPLNVTGTLSNMHGSYYSVSNLNTTTGFIFEIGARPTFDVNTNEFSLLIKLPNNPSVSPNQNRSAGTSGGSVFAISSFNAVSDTRGLFITSRTSSTSLSLYQNTTLLASSSATESNTSGGSNSIYLSGLNDAGTARHFSNRAFIFASIGQGLSGSEVSTLSSLFETFKTAIGR